MTSGYTTSKSKKYFLFLLLLTSALATCKKDSDNSTEAKYYFISDNGECSPDINGSYFEGIELTDSNSINVDAYITRKGYYDILTDSANGIQFRTRGGVSNTGPITFRLIGQGIPKRKENTRFHFSFLQSFCSFEIPVLDYTDTINTSEYAWEFYDNGVYHHGHVDSSVRLIYVENYTFAFAGNESTDSNAVFRLLLRTAPGDSYGTFTDSLNQSFEYVVDNHIVFSTYKKSSIVTTRYGGRGDIIKGSFSWTGLNDEGILHEVKDGKFYVRLDSLHVGPGVY